MTQIKFDTKYNAGMWYCIVYQYNCGLDSEMIKSISQLTTIELQRDAFERLAAPSKIVCEKGKTREEAVYNALKEGSK